MALTKTQVSELYVAIFNRASEGEGNTFWQTSKDTAADTADAMLATQAAQDYFGTSLDTNQDFIEHIYENTLGKTYAEDTDGVDFWVSRLDSGEYTRGEVVSDLVATVANYSDSTDATTKAAYDQFNNRVDVSNYMADTVQEAPADYKTSTAFDGDLTVTNASSSVDTAKSTVDSIAEKASIDGETFTLTAENDSYVGTAKNDLFDAPQGTLQTEDTILDSTSTDSDVLNATVTSVSVAPRIQNVENINIDGKYTTSGLDLESVAGTQTLTLDTAFNGTATVTNASSLNATEIVAGDKIKTMNVTATASGTRDDVTVDATDVADVNIFGDLGTDQFDVTVSDGADVALTKAGGNGGDNVDIVTMNVAGGEIDLDGDMAGESLTLNNTSEALTVNLGTGQALVGSGDSSAWKIAGDSDVTLVVADSGGTSALELDGLVMTSTNSADVTIDIEDSDVSAAEQDFSRIEVDHVKLSADGGAANQYTFNEGTYVDLTGDATAGGKLSLDVNTNVAYDKDDAYEAHEGTLLLNVSESQTTNSIVTGAGTGTVLLQATPDEDTDTQCAAEITIAGLDTEANQSAGGTVNQTGTNEVVVIGSENLTINGWTTGNTDSDGKLLDSITAEEMTGDFTLNGIASGAGVAAVQDGSSSVSVEFGQGDDTITGNLASSVTVYGTAGNNFIDLAAASGANTVNGGINTDRIILSEQEDTVKAGLGDDVVMTTSGDNTIDLGAGDDTMILADVNAAGTSGDNTVTLGDGADTVMLKADASVMHSGGDTIKDFDAANDQIVLMGAAGASGDVDVSDINISGDYHQFSDSFAVKLTNVAATDLSDSVQLGSLSGVDGDLEEIVELNQFTISGDSTVRAGSLDDVIEVATGNSGSTVTTGTGNDTILFEASGDSFTMTDSTGQTLSGGASTVTDFDINADTLVITGTNANTIDLTVEQANAASGQYVLGHVEGAAGTTSGSADIAVQLDGVTEENMADFAQLGISGEEFIVSGGTSVVGGNNSDYIKTEDTDASSIEAGAGKDYIELGTGAHVDTIVIGAGDSTTSEWDEITGFGQSGSNSGDDVLDLAAADVNIAELISDTQVGDITGVTVSDGVITGWEGIADTINEDTIDDAIAFLEENVAGTDTVAFSYADKLCDGTPTDEATYIFQSGTEDTLVELVDTTGVTSIGKAADNPDVIIA